MSATTTATCPCEKYEPHLWRIGLCKTCFHTSTDHKQGGKCTHAGEAAQPKLPFLEQWVSRVAMTKPATAPKTPLNRSGAALRAATGTFNPKQREIETLRETAAAVASMIGPEDEAAAAPQALADVFESTASSLVAAAGIQDEPFVRDFLAALKVAVSTQPLLAGTGPLAPPQLAHLRAVGKSVWHCYKLQDYLQTVTRAQGLLAASAISKRRANDPSRKLPMLGWLEGVKSMLSSERSYCLTLEGDSCDIPSVSNALRLHRRLLNKLEDTCLAYPSEQAWCVGATLSQWLEEAVPVYGVLLRELSLARKEGKEARAAFLSVIVCPRLGLYEATIKQFAQLYHALVEREDAGLTASERSVAEADLLALTHAEKTSAAAQGEATKRSEEISVPSVVHCARTGSESPQHRSSKKRRASSRRRNVSDIISAFTEPILLPENANRIVQVSGSMTAIIRTEGNPASCRAEYRHNLLSDFWIVYSDIPSPHTLVAVINLKEALVTSSGDGGVFEVSAPGLAITVDRVKPKRVEKLMREDIARLRVFGVPLEDMLLVENDQGGIPRVALLCMEFVERHGFSSEGIFRVAGKPSVMSALQTAFNSRAAEVDFSAVSAHDVAHLFKRFLFELPEPLLTNEGYKRLLNVPLPSPGSDGAELQHFVEAAREVVRALPAAHKELSRVVFAFLSVCADCSPKTKMTVANLAIVLAPVILRPSGNPNNIAGTPLMDLAAVQKANTIVQLMIENHFDIFC